jgi:hypothetical protein
MREYENVCLACHSDCDVVDCPKKKEKGEG